VNQSSFERDAQIAESRLVQHTSACMGCLARSHRAEHDSKHCGHAKMPQACMLGHATGACAKHQLGGGAHSAPLPSSSPFLCRSVCALLLLLLTALGRPAAAAAQPSRLWASRGREEGNKGEEGGERDRQRLFSSSSLRPLGIAASAVQRWPNESHSVLSTPARDPAKRWPTGDFAWTRRWQMSRSSYARLLLLLAPGPEESSCGDGLTAGQ